MLVGGELRHRNRGQDIAKDTKAVIEQSVFPI